MFKDPKSFLYPHYLASKKQYFMLRQAELETSKWSCCYVKTKITSQESGLFLSDVLTIIVLLIFIYCFLYAETFSPL